MTTMFWFTETFFRLVKDHTSVDYEARIGSFLRAVMVMDCTILVWLCIGMPWSNQKSVEEVSFGTQHLTYSELVPEAIWVFVLAVFVLVGLSLQRDSLIYKCMAEGLLQGLRSRHLHEVLQGWASNHSMSNLATLPDICLELPLDNAIG